VKRVGEQRRSSASSKMERTIAKEEGGGKTFLVGRTKGFRTKKIVLVVPQSQNIEGASDAQGRRHKKEEK